MTSFLKKHSLLLSALFLLSIVGAAMFYPAALSALGAFCILFAFIAGTAFIIEKHKGQEHVRRKTARDILILVTTLTLAIILGGVASKFAANIAGTWFAPRWAGWENLTALASAILTSFVVGYLVRWGVGKLSK